MPRFALLAAVLFSLSPAAADDDVCSCEPLSGYVKGYTISCERCGTEGPPLPCSICERRTDRCQRCFRRLPELLGVEWKISIGRPQVPKSVDASGNPRWSIETESGETVSLTGRNRWPASRVICRAYKDRNTLQWRAWEIYPLLPASQDFTVHGRSASPVHWRIGGIRSDAVVPADGRYTLTIPSSPTLEARVYAGDELLSVESARARLLRARVTAHETKPPGVTVWTLMSDAGESVEAKWIEGAKTSYSTKSLEASWFLLRLFPGEGGWVIADGVQLREEKDVVVEVEATAPVRWIYRGLSGPVVKPDNGHVRLAIPSIVTDTWIDIEEGGSVVSRMLWQSEGWRVDSRK